MSFKDFPATQKILILNEGSDIRAGAFSFASAIELKHLVLVTYFKGDFSGGESMRLKIYGGESRNKPLATTNWIRAAEIPDFNGGNWLGWLRFDLPGNPMQINNTYYVDIETAGYVRNGNTKYMSVVLQFATPLNGSNVNAMHVALVGKV